LAALSVRKHWKNTLSKLDLFQ